jgi:hypothetical protein
MEAKFRPLIKKKIDINQDEISQKTAEYILFDHKRNEEILKELKVEPVDEKLRRYKSSCQRHVKRMNSNNRMKKIMMIYRSN